jgi:hypothetical protein
MHPRGHGMRPSREACEIPLRSYSGRVVATCETGLGEGVAAYWRDMNVSSAVYDVAEPRLDEWRAWQNWQHRDPGSPANGNEPLARETQRARQATG